MFSFEMNKIAGAVLGALLLAVSLVVVSDTIFSHPRLAKAGYVLPAATKTASAVGGPAAPAALPLSARLTQADVKKGGADTKACQACHNFERGAPAKAGPPLYGIVDRPKGSVAGFAYSDAIKSKGGVWTLDDLDQFIANPKAYASGTKMTYSGERDGAKRADIIAYLDSLSDHPAPLATK